MSSLPPVSPRSWGEAPEFSSGQAAGQPRPSVMQLVFRDKAALYAAYMPALTHGGLFVPTQREHRLGEDAYLLVALPDDPTRHPVAGKVAWITPAQVSGGRTPGVGVAFPDDEKTRILRQRIESMLGTTIASARLTQTL
jgi:type IV pilus assembly protein PilZ